MSTVNMNSNAVLIFTVYIAAYMITSLNYMTSFPPSGYFMSNYTAKQSTSYN